MTTRIELEAAYDSAITGYNASLPTSESFWAAACNYSAAALRVYDAMHPEERPAVVVGNEQAIEALYTAQA